MPCFKTSPQNVYRKYLPVCIKKHIQEKDYSKTSCMQFYRVFLIRERGHARLRMNLKLSNEAGRTATRVALGLARLRHGDEALAADKRKIALRPRFACQPENVPSAILGKAPVTFR